MKNYTSYLDFIQDYTAKNNNLKTSLETLNNDLKDFILLNNNLDYINNLGFNLETLLKGFSSGKNNYDFINKNITYDLKVVSSRNKANGDDALKSDFIVVVFLNNNNSYDIELFNNENIKYYIYHNKKYINYKDNHNKGINLNINQFKKLLGL